MAGFWSRWGRRRDDEPTSGDQGIPPQLGEGEDQESSPPISSSESSGVRPVTTARIESFMRQRDYRYLRDEKGNVCGLWMHRFFTFHLIRERVLQVRGQWTRRPGIERLSEFLDFIDQWNGAHHHPRTYLRVLDDGQLSIVAEVSVPIGCGLNDAQLDHFLSQGISANSTFFNLLDRSFVDPLTRVDS